MRRQANNILNHAANGRVNQAITARNNLANNINNSNKVTNANVKKVFAFMEDVDGKLAKILKIITSNMVKKTTYKFNNN